MDSFSEYLNKLVKSSLPSQQEKSLEENISLLKKNLCTKVEIIKKLVKTISAKSNSHQSNILNQSSSSLPSNSLNKNSHNTKQLVSQKQRDPPIVRPCSSQL